MGDLFYKLAHTVMSLRSHRIWSLQARKTGKAGGVIQFMSKGLRAAWANRESPDPHPKARDPRMLASKGRWRWMFQLKPRAKSPLYLFVLLEPSLGWVMSTCIRESNLLYSVYWFWYFIQFTLFRFQCFFQSTDSKSLMEISLEAQQSFTSYLGIP